VVKITLLIVLVFLAVGGLGVFTVVYTTHDDVERQYSQAAEEPMVDVAQIFAAMIEKDIVDGVIDVSGFRAGFRQAHQRQFEAKIYSLHKSEVFTHVYITDEKGVVIFDSDDGRREGMNYAEQRDVHLTMNGKYGARSTRLVPDDPRSSTFYVAAAIRDQGEILGVVSVSRPETAMAPFVDETRSLIVRTGIWAGIVTLVLGSLWVYWLMSPIGRLSENARKISAGERGELQTGGVAELRELGKSLETMRDELEGRHYVESYVQALTHEIKSPLSAIQGAAELLEEKDMPVEQRDRFLANIRAETKRCEEIVRRLVQLAALESQHALDRVESLNFVELAVEESEIVRPRMEARQLRMVLDMPEIESVANLRGDRLALQLALRNLLSNAVDFSLDGGEVRLSIERPDSEHLAFVVEDDGPGIPDYAEERVFERFYSLRNSEAGRKGSGLGLCFVREAAELHGGRIELHNRKPHGLRAVLTLPI
jgi:two-component system sensor histidine kinase CreC